MRNLPPLFALLLVSLLSSATIAQASLLPLSGQVQPLVAFDEEEETEDEDAEDAAEEAEIEREICEEDPELCEEEEASKKGKSDGGDECLLKSAKASLIANPGKQRLRLTVHYKTLKPATVSIEASLESSKGTVHLGTDHAHFRRSGVYRDSYQLTEKETKKAAVARGFSVELQVVNSPASCRVELTGPSRLAKR